MPLPERLESLMHPVNLFVELPVMEEALAHFKRCLYAVYELDCRESDSQQDILSAVLHKMGLSAPDASPDTAPENIGFEQFSDLFHIEATEAAGTVLALRYFDTFYRLDPASGQQMLNVMAPHHYRQLKEGKTFIICAHCEDQGLELKPVVTVAARWNDVDSFSRKADTRDRKLANFMGWIELVSAKINEESAVKLDSFQVVTALEEIAGGDGRLVDFELVEAMQLSVDAAVELLKDYDYETAHLGNLARRRTRKFESELNNHVNER